MKKSVRKGSVLVLSGLVLGLCFSMACQDKAAIAELEKQKAQALVEELNVASFRHMLEETDKGNYAAWDEVCSPDYISHWGAVSFSLEEHKQANRPLLAAFPDFKHGINNMIAKGDRVVARVTLTGTHNGEYMGIPATGNKINYSAVLEARFSGGKLVEMWGVADILTLMQQLGMELRPEEAKKK